MFIWLFLVLVAAHRIFIATCGIFSSPTRDQTWAPCSGNTVLASGPPGKSLSFCVSINAFQNFNFNYLFLAGLGLCDYVQTSSSCGAGDSHCSGFYCCGAWALDTPASVFATHGLTCPLECGIFLNQGSKSCPQH